MDTFVFSPLLLSGFVEQKQFLTVEFYNNYIDDSVSFCATVNIVVHIHVFIKLEILTSFLLN